MGSDVRRRRRGLSPRILQLAVVYGFGLRWDRCTVSDDAITFVNDGVEVFDGVKPGRITFAPYFPSRAA